MARRLARELDRMGHDSWCYATDADLVERLEQGTERRARVYPLGKPASWFRSPLLASALEREATGFDVLHLHGMWIHPVLAASRVARRRRIPYVVSPHGTLEPWSVHRKRLKKTLYLHAFGRRMLNGASCLHAVTPPEIGGFRNAGYTGPVTVIPNGVDLEEFSGADPATAEEAWPQLTGKTVVLFLSRLSPEKGLDLLLRAWSDMSSRRRDEERVLVVAGPGSPRYSSKIRLMISELGVERSVLLTGMVRGAVRAALYARADVFVLPSYSENFGIVVAEAMASGTPVITTTGTPWKSIEDISAGLWVPPSSGALCEAILAILGLPDAARREMGQRGRRFVERAFSWKTPILPTGTFLNVSSTKETSAVT